MDDLWPSGSGLLADAPFLSVTKMRLRASGRPTVEDFF